MDGSAEYKKEVWWWIEWKVFLCAWLSVRGKWGEKEKVWFQSGCTISTIVDKEFFHRPASTPPPSSWSCPDLVGEATWRPVNSDARRLENSRQMRSVWRMVVVEKEPLWLGGGNARSHKKKISLWTRDDSVSKFEYCINLLTWNLLFALPWIYEKLKLHILEGV